MIERLDLQERISLTYTVQTLLIQSIISFRS